MTLTKLHYQRLWFPPHGEGGVIPSRAEYGLSKEEFDKVFPKEFWREVVDRIAEEAPDTLLLAEAFWLLEGYFVRTLGMHRVYNSAFMNMLKMEDNGKYRKTVKNVLEFNPEVLKRFVNFMNNPDEETAIAQFGKGDKYIGVALMMVTMPGLPMFGHGQIEGYSEKYGMEYRKAYWDEQIDNELVTRHEHEVFPLMRKRHLFSGVDNFAFYDFFTPEGWVDENVFAYSNMHGSERALIVYNNAYNSTQGWIKMSVGMSLKVDQKGNRRNVHKSLSDSLNLRVSDDCYHVFRDTRTNLEYIRKSTSIKHDGLFFNLSGYQYYALINFREIIDTDGTWQRLEEKLRTKDGVPDIEAEHKALILEPVLTPLQNILSYDNTPEALYKTPKTISFKKLEDQLDSLYSNMSDFSFGTRDNKKPVIAEIISLLDCYSFLRTEKKALFTKILPSKEEPLTRKTAYIYMVWSILDRTGKLFDTKNRIDNCLKCIDELLFKKVLLESLEEANFDFHSANDILLLLKSLILNHHNYSLNKFHEVLNDETARSYIGINSHNNVLWYSKEKFEELCDWLGFVYVLNTLSTNDNTDKQIKTIVSEICKLTGTLKSKSDDASYQLDTLEKTLIPHKAK